MRTQIRQHENIKFAAGIDLASSVIATARRIGCSNRINHAGLPWPRSAGSGAASENLAKAGIDTVGCLPVGQALTVWIEAPFASRNKARRVFPALLDIQLPFSIEECVCGFYEETSRSNSGQRALALAARLDTAQARLKAYRDAGFDPVYLDYEGFALWTQALDEFPNQSDWRAVALLEPGRAAVAIGHGRRFINAHNIRLLEGAEAAAAFSAELAPILSAELPAAARLEWILAGSIAEKPAWSTALGGASARVAAEPACFLARALAARAVRSGLLRCNLRAGSLAHPAAERRAAASRRGKWQILAAGAFFVCVLNGLWPFWCNLKVARFDREITTRAGMLAPGATLPRGQEIREVELYQASLKPFLESWSGSLLPDLGLIVQTAAASDIKIAELQLQSGELLLQGSVESWRQAESFAEGIKALNWSVELQRGSGIGSGETKFTIKGKRSQ